jgi:hypothetical protein
LVNDYGINRIYFFHEHNGGIDIGFDVDGRPLLNN